MTYQEYLQSAMQAYKATVKQAMERDSNLIDASAELIAKKAIAKTFLRDLPGLLKDSNFKSTFIANQAESIFTDLDYILSVSPSEPVTLEVLDLFLKDEGLTEKFIYKNSEIIESLDTICKLNPDIIGPLLRNGQLIKAIQELRPYFSIHNLLILSRSKKDADYVFAHPELFGGEYTEEKKTAIYNKISENYKKTLPESLQTQSLFAIANSNSLQINSLPETLQDSIRNIKPGKGF